MKKIIMVERRRDYYKAWIKGHPETWVRGETANQAVRNLIFHQLEFFGIEIQKI